MNINLLMEWKWFFRLQKYNQRKPWNTPEGWFVRCPRGHLYRELKYDLLSIVWDNSNKQVYSTNSDKMLSRMNDHLGFRDQQGCPSFQGVANGFNSCPGSSELDCSQIAFNFRSLWSTLLSSQPNTLVIGNPCGASFTLFTRSVAMCPATNSSLGKVKTVFASLDFEVTRSWVMLDDWCVTAYRLLKCPCYWHLRKREGRYLRFLLGILFQSAFFPSSPSCSLIFWEDHNPVVLRSHVSLYSVFQSRWRVKVILKGRIS